MELEALLKDLRSVKGYVASGVATFTGELLAGDSVDPNLDLALTAAMTNDVLRHAHEGTAKFANSVCEETLIRSRTSWVAMRCTGLQAKAHLHICCVLTSDGNTALTRMMMEKIAVKAADIVGAK